MNSFKILKETMIQYGKQDQLYLMCIDDGKKCYIQIDSRNGFIARKNLQSRKDAELLFLEVKNGMNSYNSIDIAIDTLRLAFVMNTIDETRFIINCLHTRVELHEIWSLQYIYNFRTEPEQDMYLYACLDFNNTLEVVFAGNTTPLGRFKAPDSKSKFHFELYPKELKL